MADKYYLNAALKARAAKAVDRKTDGEIALDDISRVKVLSPGRQVFKRFIRNRLAVFGSMLLIFMFVFSFIGPLFYSYGQKQIFYKFDRQTVNYAMAKDNTAYNGYDIDPDAAVERTVNNAMNSRIKSMIADGDTLRFEMGKDNAYEIEKLRDDIYRVSIADLTPICTYGSSTVNIGTYSQVRKTIEFRGEEVEGLADAMTAAVKKNAGGGSFTYGGVTYSYKKGQAKTYAVSASFDGLRYIGEPMDESFEAALEAAAEKGESFVCDGAEYILVANGAAWDVYRRNAARPARVFSRLTVDTFESGAPVSNELRVNALLAAGGSGRFTADGQQWTVAEEDGFLIVRGADGAEYMELTPFSVRRYTGEDSMEYSLKKAVAEKVEEMIEAGAKSGSMACLLPMQGESGEYVYDENGVLQYQEAELVISQRETGEFVITAEQTIYVIDRFSAPSSRHILGTDGDGFDVLARIMYGGRVSLMVGFVVVFLEIFLGVIMGGLAGYYGGWVDMLIMRLVDIFYCLPSLPIMIILGAMMDALRMNTYVRLLIMMAALGIMGWAGVARLVRGQILSLREQEFMVATEATGIKVKGRIFHHLVPNVMPQLIVTATMGMGSVIITESTLSFLGLGVKHPLATWGTMINSVSSASAMAHYAYIWIPVGLLICLTVIAFNFVGDGLRDAYDPKAKR
ncbi:MAG: ABC transporter permease [Oscillospiraceae bacterium]|nr:ABC transporter permease [Oscillospiraceae bacterium]